MRRQFPLAIASSQQMLWRWINPSSGTGSVRFNRKG
jgi:hypothetical protein